MNRVRQAIKASAAQLTRSIVSPQLVNDILFQFIVATPSEFNDVDFDCTWCIFEENMYQLYNGSSFGWDPPQKREELYHPLSRFILVRAIGKEVGQERPPIAAFVMFRFERENKENVVYCYEIQVSKRYRRHGLGKILMHQLADISASWEMHKIMLTAFKANVTALRFYEALGFTVDATSPGYADDDEWIDEGALDCDYEIMSKVIDRK